MHAHRYTTFRMAIWGGILFVVLLIVLAIWAFSDIHYPFRTRSQLHFPASQSFAELRVKLISPSATAVIVQFDGFELLDERLEEVDADPSPDSQAVLRTLMGEPPADYRFKRQLLARVRIPEFGTEQISLMQTIRLDADVIEITTEANQPTGNLQTFRHHLLAEALPPPAPPRVTLTIEFTPRVETPRVLAWTIERRLQQLADQALLHQRRQLDQLLTTSMPFE